MQTVFHSFREFHILQADSVNVINQVASQRQDVNALQLESLGIMRFGRGAYWHSHKRGHLFAIFYNNIVVSIDSCHIVGHFYSILHVCIIIRFFMNKLFNIVNFLLAGSQSRENKC